MTTIDRANQAMENACCGGCCGSCDFPRLARALADAGLLAPDGTTYEYGDNGWDDETNSPMHYPVEPSCRDDDHACPEPAPPRYRRPVGPWEEA